MDLQSTFYVLGIICMILFLIILVGIAVMVFYIKKKVDDVHRLVTYKIKEFTAPAEAAMDIGSAVAGLVLKRFRSVFGR